MKLKYFYNHLGLSQRIVFPFLGVFFCVLALGGLILASWFTDSLEQSLRSEVENFALQITPSFTAEQQTLQNQLRLLANREKLQVALEQRDLVVLRQLLLPLKAELELDLLQVVTPQGTILLDSRQDSLANAKLQESLAIASASSGSYWSDYVHTEIQALTPIQTLVTAVAPVRSNQRFLGGVIAGILIQDELLQKFSAGSPQKLALLQADQVIATTLPELRQAVWEPPLPGRPAKRVQVKDAEYLTKTVTLPTTSKTLRLVLLYPVTSLELAKQSLVMRLMILFGLGGLIVAIIGHQIGGAIATQLNRQFEELQQALQDLKETQAQLIQAEKMSSLGQLVAGVAHEINNPVNFINGNIDYVSRYTQELLGLTDLYQHHYPNPHPEIADYEDGIDVKFLTEDLAKILSSMKMGTDRIRQIVLSLRNFSRLDEADMKVVSLHDGLDNTLLILNHRLKQGIIINKQYGPLPPVECYPAQLNQVFMNLLANAIDSLMDAKARADYHEQSFSPEITIQTEMGDRKFVRIRIRDNGIGMAPPTMNKIFDAFFTTKPVGKGTGLGLSISYQIIKKHQGKIEVHSQPHRGAEFVITLPVKQPPGIQAVA